MIKANELRLNSWVNTVLAKAEEQVTGISSQQVRDGAFYLIKTPSGTFLQENISPIKLTPEVLEKCGFVKKGDWYMLPEICLGFITTESNYEIEVRVAGIDKWNLISIKSLHHLQNIFYALTGTELTYHP